METCNKSNDRGAAVPSLLSSKKQLWQLKHEGRLVGKIVESRKSSWCLQTSEIITFHVVFAWNYFINSYPMTNDKGFKIIGFASVN
jgi:hypothetical protein